MENIEQIFYRKINASDFKKMYDIDKPATGGGQTYIEAAGIDSSALVEFLKYGEISDSSLEGEDRMTYTLNTYVLGSSKGESKNLEFAPRKGRANYRIIRQNMKNKHPAWHDDNGFPIPKKNNNGNYTSEGDFK